MEDALSPGVVGVPPEASVAEVAQRMQEHRIHRVVVLEDDKLWGVISTFDLIGLLAEP